MFSKTYELRYSDFKDFDTVKISSVLDMVQDTATKHSESLGFGVNELRELGVAWFIRGIEIKLFNTPETNKPIEVSTGIKTLKGTVSDRCTAVFQGGKRLANCVASWFLFDTKENKIARIPPEISEVYPVESFDESFPSFKKPQIAEDAPVISEILVSNRDIDTNMHLNNVKGAELLMNALPFDFVPYGIRILYKKSAYLGDRLKLCALKIQNGYYVHLADMNGEICVAGTFESGE